MLCYTQEGSYLTVQKSHFKPAHDLSIMLNSGFCNKGAVSLHFYFDQVNEHQQLAEMWDIIANMWEDEEKKRKALQKYNDSQLRTLRNTLFALNGYQFNDKALSRYFQQFIWYHPDPSLPNSTSILTEEQLSFFKIIRKVEND